MKNLFKSIAMLVIAGSLFASCSKDGDSATTSTTSGTVGDPTLTVTPTAPVSVRFNDTVKISVTATPATGAKIKGIAITRVVATGLPKIVYGDSSSTSLGDGAITRNFNDVIINTTGNITDNITYTIVVTDDKGKTASKTVTGQIIGLYSSGQFLLGVPANTTNLNRFFGFDGSESKTVKLFKAGVATAPDVPSAADSATRARFNADKIDVLYFYNSAGSIGHAIYAPSYAFASGSGWQSEISNWPTGLAKGTLLKVTSLSQSQFEAPDFNVEETIKAIDFTSATTDRIVNLAIGQVVGIKTVDGKRGLLAVVQVSAGATGQITFETKWFK